MQSILLPTLEQTYASLTYLYRLRPGFAGTSHAVQNLDFLVYDKGSDVTELTIGASSYSLLVNDGDPNRSDGVV